MSSYPLLASGRCANNRARLIKTAAVCFFVFAPLIAGSALAGPESIAGTKQMILNAYNQGACKQLAFEYSGITQKSCMAAEHQGLDQLLAMLPHSNSSQRGYYWGECVSLNRLGSSGIGIDYAGMVKCIKFTRAKCPPHPPNGAYGECLQALDDYAFEHP